MEIELKVKCRFYTENKTCYWIGNFEYDNDIIELEKDSSIINLIMKCKEIVEEKCNINYYFGVGKYDFPMDFLVKDQDNNTIDVIPHKIDFDMVFKNVSIEGKVLTLYHEEYNYDTLVMIKEKFDKYIAEKYKNKNYSSKFVRRIHIPIYFYENDSEDEEQGVVMDVGMPSW